MSVAPQIPILLCPVLTVDHSLSMQLYLANLQAALEPFGDRFDFEVVVPPSAKGDSWASKQWKRYIAYPRLLARRLRERPGAVLHVLDHSYGHLCRADVPTVLTCHGLENFRLKLRLFWQQALWVRRVKAMGRARRIVAISGDVAKDTERFARIPPERIVLDYYGVDPVFSPAGETVTALAARRAAGDLLVLHVGMNIARKNIGLLLEALGLLRARGLPVRFVKVGKDPREDGYGPQMKRLGLLEHYDYLGWLSAPAVAAVCRSCDVLAFPSIHEGFGRPIIEAQACGLPVVVADTASAREIAGAGALVHVPDDAGDLAARLNAVLTEPAVRDRQIAAGFENVRRFSWAEHARVLAEIYTQLHAGA